MWHTFLPLLWKGCFGMAGEFYAETIIVMVVIFDRTVLGRIVKTVTPFQ